MLSHAHSRVISHAKFLHEPDYDQEAQQVQLDLYLTTKHYAGQLIMGELFMEQESLGDLNDLEKFLYPAEELTCNSANIKDEIFQFLSTTDGFCEDLAVRLTKEVFDLLRKEVEAQGKSKSSISLDVHVSVETVQFRDEEITLTLNPASKSAIERLEKGIFVEDDNICSKCVVCINQFSDGEEFSKMPCKHMFHSECITSWLEMKNTCPLCRSNI